LLITFVFLLLFVVNCQAPPLPTPMPVAPIATPVPTEDIRPSVIQAVFETQTAVAQPFSATQIAEVQSLRATRTAEARQFADALKAVETRAAQAAKTEAAIQIAAALTALVPTPTRTRTPTITLTPTVTPTSTPTFTPGLHFVTLRWEPPNPYTGDTIVFIVSFENTLTQLQQIRWRVEIMDVDNAPIWSKLFFATEPLVTDIVTGRYEFKAEPPWRIAASAGRRNFMLRVVELDISNSVVRILSTPSGQVDFPLYLVPRPR
jgi:hypothetical protein